MRPTHNFRGSFGSVGVWLWRKKNVNETVGKDGPRERDDEKIRGENLMPGSIEGVNDEANLWKVETALTLRSLGLRGNRFANPIKRATLSEITH
jgi:hypothetical protein